jgi:predicted negative regulator of RcsB-dependent stress response
MAQGEDKMNAQGQEFFGTRGFRIGVIAALAVVVLAGAAYFFGTGLRADTSASVAPSPIGSSLTAVRESISKDYVERLSDSSAAARSASLAALAKSRSDFYAELNNSAAAATSGSSAASRFADRYDRMSTSSAAAASASAGLSNLEYARKFGIPAASVPSVSADLEQRSAPFYAGLDKGLRDQGIRPSARSSSGMASSSAAVQSQWIKPEGIKPSVAPDSAEWQSPWIKPEGIRAN